MPENSDIADEANVPVAGGMQRDVLHVLLLVMADAFAVYQAFVLAFAIRMSSMKPLSHHMTMGQFSSLIAALTPVWITFFALAGLYSVKLRRGRPSELGRVFLAVGTIVMAMVMLAYLMPDSAILPSRSVPLMALPLGVVFVFLARQIVRRVMRWAQSNGHAMHHVVLIGGGDLALRIAAELSYPGSGYRIVAVVDPRVDGGTFLPGVPVVGTLDNALALAGPRVDEVIQADIDLDRAEVARMMSRTTASGITYRFVPDQYGVYAAASTMSTIAGIPVMGVRLTSLDGWGSIAKRTFDIVGSLALMLVLSPVWVGTAVMVKITDPAGPVFYSQQRVGRGGAPIRVLKFRSMCWRYSTGPNREFQHPIEAFAAMGRPDLVEEFRRDHKVLDDPRITRFGRFLRRTSLDELPQLLNSLRGELSIIGPRPITTEELERYGNQRASFLALKPGITGLWQVSGRSDVSYDERVKLDVFYAENWSMKLDLAILAKTTSAVLAKKGAY